MAETFDEAVERLRRETRLGQQIEELAAYLRAAKGSPGSALGYLFSGPQLALLVGQLGELRGRRMAMGREPDDEVNAAADLCGHREHMCLEGVPAPQFRGGCPLRPAPHLQPGWQPDEPRLTTTFDELCLHCGRWLGRVAGSPEEQECDDPEYIRTRGATRARECTGAAMPGDLSEVPQDGVFCAQCNDLGRCDDENADGGYCDCIAGRTEAGLDAADEAMARLTPYGEGPTATRSGPLLRCGLYRAALCPVAGGGGQVDCLACEPLSEEPELGCTGVSATWCPVHGECTCAHDYDLNEPDCPLHGTANDHAEAPPDPEAIARRLLGELGPELAAAVCVQLLGRLQRREP